MANAENCEEPRALTACGFEAALLAARVLTDRLAYKTETDRARSEAGITITYDALHTLRAIRGCTACVSGSSTEGTVATCPIKDDTMFVRGMAASPWPDTSFTPDMSLGNAVTKPVKKDQPPQNGTGQYL